MCSPLHCIQVDAFLVHLPQRGELAHSSIRITLGRFTTEEEVDYAAELIKNKVAKLRELSPLWEMYQEGIDLNSVQWAAH